MISDDGWIDGWLAAVRSLNFITITQETDDYTLQLNNIKFPASMYQQATKQQTDGEREADQ
jgi:hypothetical protein